MTRAFVIGMFLVGCSKGSISLDDSDTDTDSVYEDPYAGRFDPDHVMQVDIQMNSGDWDELREQGRSMREIIEQLCSEQPFEDVFDYFSATVTVDGVGVEQVGVRKKGFLGSLSDSKPSLKIKFHAYLPDQRLDGMKRLTLNNANQDASMLNTCLSYEVFRAAGYPAPRCSFAHVTVNGVDLGPYVHVESMKRPFLRLHFGDPDGHFYEGQVSDFRPDLDWSFQRKHDDMPEDNPDVAAATMALGNTDTGWYEDVEALFDIDAYLTFWAVEVLVGHWDSYNGNRNNYYVYNDPSQDRFVFLPWGPDSAFQPLENPFDEISYPPSLSAHGMLGHRLWERPESQQAYVKRLLDVLDTAWDEAHLHAEVERMSELIMPLMSNSRRYQALADLDRIHAFIDRQRPAILEDVADGPVEWNHELPSVTCW